MTKLASTLEVLNKKQSMLYLIKNKPKISSYEWRLIVLNLTVEDTDTTD